MQPGEAAEGAHSGAHLAGDAAGLPDADLARGDGTANPLHRLLKIRCMTQRRHADPEPLGGVLRPGGTRQQLPEERPQEARFAVEQSRGGLRVSPPSLKRQDAPLRIADAARPALRIAGMALRETAALVPLARTHARGRAQRKKIRSKLLNFLDSASGMQQRAANGGRIGRFGHWRVP